MRDAWPAQGGRAAQLFHAYHELLADRANAYLDSVFEAPPTGRRRAAPAQVPAPAAPAELLAAGYYQLSQNGDRLAPVGGSKRADG